MKIGKKIIEWDEIDLRLNNEKTCREESIEELKEELGENYCEKCFNDKVEKRTDWKLEDLTHDEYQWNMEILREYMDKKNKGTYWRVTVKNFGWAKRYGYKYVDTYEAKKLIQECIPDCECNYRVFNYGKGFYMTISHHDGGGNYVIMPVSNKTWDEYGRY